MDMETRIIESFRRVKTDILSLQQKITELSQQQERMLELVTDTRDKESKLYNQIKDIKKQPATKVIRPKVKFIASKAGNKVHVAACPFAKNIAPKNRLEFKSKKTALNKGLKPCECMKKV